MGILGLQLGLAEKLIQFLDGVGIRARAGLSGVGTWWLFAGDFSVTGYALMRFIIIG